MAYVSRAQYDMLERRVIRAEQVITMMQMRLDQMQGYGMGQNFLGMGSRTSPYPSSTPSARMTRSRSPPKFSGPEMSVEEFCSMNNLDPTCSEALASQPEEVQKAVIMQGKAEGRNPSAMVMGRIAKLSSGPSLTRAIDKGDLENIGEKIEEFIAMHTLDEKCADSLRSQAPECQAAVIAVGPADGRNPSAMIVGRIAKWSRGEL